MRVSVAHTPAALVFLESITHTSLPPLAGVEAPPYLCLQLVSRGEAALGQSALQIKCAHGLCIRPTEHPAPG